MSRRQGYWKDVDRTTDVAEESVREHQAGQEFPTLQCNINRNTKPAVVGRGEKNLKAIIFDCDGVPEDSEIVACRAVAGMIGGKLPGGMPAERFMTGIAGRKDEDILHALRPDEQTTE